MSFKDICLVVPVIRVRRVDLSKHCGWHSAYERKKLHNSSPFSMPINTVCFSFERKDTAYNLLRKAYRVRIGISSLPVYPHKRVFKCVCRMRNALPLIPYIKSKKLKAMTIHIIACAVCIGVFLTKRRSCRQ